MPVPDNLGTLVTSIASILWLVCAASAAGGILIVATVQGLSDLLPIRGPIQGLYLYAWMLKRCLELKEEVRSALDRPPGLPEGTAADWEKKGLDGIIVSPEKGPTGYYGLRSKYSLSRFGMDVLVLFLFIPVFLLVILPLLVVGMFPFVGRFVPWVIDRVGQKVIRHYFAVAIRVPDRERAWRLTDAAMRRLIRLATAGDPVALFTLPVDQFSGQLGRAMDAMMGTPAGYALLLFLFAQGANLDDLKSALSRTGERSPETLAAHGRIADKAQRSLDSIQITLGNFWENGMMQVGMIVGLIFLVTYQPTKFESLAKQDNWLMPLVLVGWISSGFFATVLRGLFASARDPRRRGR